MILLKDLASIISVFDEINLYAKAYVKLKYIGLFRI